MKHPEYVESIDVTETMDGTYCVVATSYDGTEGEAEGDERDEAIMDAINDLKNKLLETPQMYQALESACKLFAPEMGIRTGVYTMLDKIMLYAEIDGEIFVDEFIGNNEVYLVNNMYTIFYEGIANHLFT